MSVPTPSEHHLTLNRLATIARLMAGVAHEVNNARRSSGFGGTLQNRTTFRSWCRKHHPIRADGPRRVGDDGVALSRTQPDGASQVDIRDVASRAVNCGVTPSGVLTWRCSQPPLASQFVQGTGCTCCRRCST